MARKKTPLKLKRKKWSSYLQLRLRKSPGGSQITALEKKRLLIIIINPSKASLVNKKIN